MEVKYRRRCEKVVKSMIVKDITDVIEAFAPLALQEGYDNAGLIVGRPEDEVQGVLLAVDVTEEVLDEALSTGCNMVVTHHPIIFHPLKRLNSASYVERCVERAVRSGIALYACHTNLDSAPQGMSWRLGSMLGVEGLSLLQPSGRGDGAGFGVVGELPQPMPATEFLRHIARVTGADVIRYSDIVKEQVRRVAVCTGAGSSCMADAIRVGADVYVTADLKYNDFMTPSGALTVVDIGHFESEYCAIEILFDVLSKKMLTFAVRRSEHSRNPINYFRG